MDTVTRTTEAAMNATKLTAFAATAAVAASALAPAAGMAKATGPGKYTVTKQVYVYKEPGKIFDGTVIVNGGYDAQSGNAAIARGEADLVAFGVPFLANPDLPARYRSRAALNAPDQATFYAG